MRLALESVCEVEEHYLGLIEGLSEQISAIYHDPGDGPVLTRGPFVAAIRRILQDGERERTLDPGDGPRRDCDAAVQRDRMDLPAHAQRSSLAAG